MATAFRAIVMLVVLVGLPAAWVYYGPLPPAAMGVIQRTVATAKQSVGWDATVATTASPKTAPQFDASIVQATRVLQQQAVLEQAALPLQPQAALPPQPQAALPPQPLMRDARFSLASATVPVAEPIREPAAPVPPAAPEPADGELTRQLEPHLSLLRSLGAAEYTLEDWGGKGQLYRFCCAVALGENDDHTRQFEAVDADPLRAVHQVVGEVTSWQNARHVGGASRWR